jgi:hypothetical protein
MNASLTSAIFSTKFDLWSSGRDWGIAALDNFGKAQHSWLKPAWFLRLFNPPLLLCYLAGQCACKYSVRMNALCVTNARVFSFVVCDLIFKHNIWTQFFKFL